MASQRTVLAVRPLTRQSVLFAFQQQYKPGQQWQPLLCSLSTLARPRVPATSRLHPCAISLATRIAARTRTYSTHPSHAQPTYQEPDYQPPQPQPQRSRIWRVAIFLFRAWLYIGIGSVVGRYATAFVLAGQKEETNLKLVTPEDEQDAERITNHILSHPLARELEADPHYHATHPHYRVPAVFRIGNVTADTLIGPGLMAVPPFVWQDAAGQDLVMILHVGKGLCGHPDIVHGGFVATLLDEALAWCCFKAVPYEIAMTATLDVNYRAPTPADSYLVLRAHTEKVEGRKAIVKGRLETLAEPGSSQPGTLLAEASGLFVSPRSARALAGLRKFLDM
ncbi:hypothetical protein SEPCBS119000_002886 [Sporothrix epigloea]|uniref:Thioesterase domain-containing protein n=1 Tax=Sporothrix epigloea TaxID=1892477 RepID=A0ABP0DJV7_9PEZI